MDPLGEAYLEETGRQSDPYRKHRRQFIEPESGMSWQIGLNVPQAGEGRVNASTKVGRGLGLGMRSEEVSTSLQQG